jgi:hypothetical protein
MGGCCVIFRAALGLGLVWLLLSHEPSPSFAGSGAAHETIGLPAMEALRPLDKVLTEAKNTRLRGVSLAGGGEAVRRQGRLALTGGIR